LIADGALKEDFQVELLGIYPLDECLEKEKKLAKTSLFPKGLNGNAGTFIVQTDEVKQQMSRSLTGRVVSSKQRRKMSESHRRGFFIRTA
jgi:hypothetical protein